MKSIHAFSILAFLGVIIGAFLLNRALATPGGPTVSYISNSSTDTSAGAVRSDPGGYIYTVGISAVLQDTAWKAYVGNITGRLTLDDANTYTIYDWTLATPSGEVYVSRDNSVTWANVGCSNSGNVTNEESQLLMAASAVDNINKTFNETAHRSFLVGTVNISDSTCKTAYTYVNDTRQSPDVTNNFQEVLLSDGYNVIFTTLIVNDALAYRDGATFDFQTIVADNASSGAAPVSYYFWVELG
jgi:hypothetical protein